MCNDRITAHRYYNPRAAQLGEQTFKQHSAQEFQAVAIGPNSDIDKVIAWPEGENAPPTIIAPGAPWIGPIKADFKFRPQIEVNAVVGGDDFSPFVAPRVELIAYAGGIPPVIAGRAPLRLGLAPQYGNAAGAVQLSQLSATPSPLFWNSSAIAQEWDIPSANVSGAGGAAYIPVMGRRRVSFSLFANDQGAHWRAWGLQLTYVQPRFQADGCVGVNTLSTGPAQGGGGWPQSPLFPAGGGWLAVAATKLGTWVFDPSGVDYLLFETYVDGVQARPLFCSVEVSDS